MKNMTDPNTMRAKEMPRNSDAKVAGDDDSDAVAKSDGKGMGRGGDPRMWMIMVQRS